MTHTQHVIELEKSIINILKGWGLRVKVRVEAKKGSGVWKKKGDYSRDSGHELEVHEQGDIPRWDENASGHEGAIRV